MTTTAIVPASQGSLVVAMAERYGLQPEKFLSTLKATVFPHGEKDRAPTNEEMAVFLTVAKQYELNPFIKEIYAFPAKGGGIVPIVSVDGWCSLINRQPQLDGIEFIDKLTENGLLEAVTCKIFRKDRARATEVTEYMRECVRQTDPWSKYPFRMLRHKALIQCARYAFALSGIYDPDEAERIAESGEKVIYYDTPAEKTTLVTDKLRQFNQSKNGPELPSGASEVPDQIQPSPDPPNAAGEASAAPETTSPAAPPTAEVQPHKRGKIYKQEVRVTDVEKRVKKGKEWILLDCEMSDPSSPETTYGIALQCWHKNTLFEPLLKALDKDCVFGIERHENTGGDIHYTVEEIHQIGNVTFSDNIPLASPPASQLGFGEK